MFEKFWRYLLDDEWKDTSPFFLNKPERYLGGVYWFWLFAPFGLSAPKLMIQFTRMGPPHEVNGVKTDDKIFGKNGFKGMTSCWYYENGKINDLFIEQCVVKLGKGEIHATTKSGYEISLVGSVPSYNFRITKGKRIIADIRNNGSNLDSSTKFVYDNAFNKKSYFSKDRVAYFLFDETIRFPQVLKLLNVFSSFGGKILGKKVRGISYSERNATLGAFAPWRYLIYDFKNGSKLRFFCIPKPITNNKANFDFTFDYSKNKKKYVFTSGKSVYLTADKKERKILDKYVKYILVTGTNGEHDVEILSEIVANHCYSYSSLGFAANYYQIIPKIKYLKINGDSINLDEKKLGENTGYAEHVSVSLLNRVIA
jgi:hypothetical protein